nr:class I SAM-dependent methyltransferase [Actinomycetota bacterium]
MDLDAFRWLLTPEGQALLTGATQMYPGRPAVDAMRRSEHLRRQASAEHVAAAMTQVELRSRAELKFGAVAASMYFTRDGLEQATRLRVAEHRAARIASAAPSSVLDLGCGIGGDLVAFARAGLTAAGVDRDELRVAVASANLEALGLGGATRVADATDLDLAGFGVVFADPSRRSPRGRVFDVGQYSPAWEFVESLLRRASCVKVAPGVPHELVPDGVEVEWVSDEGKVKEAALWSAHLALVRRRATVIRPTGLATLTDRDDPGSPEH